jgi:LPPG:FO 2-phospho-L-lactate transferase
VSPGPGQGPVVVLAGGTGGAKLARGMLDVAGPDGLVVIANTGDDIEVYGGYVSPDPDLVTFWLGDLIDERGWGLAGDTFAVMDGLRELGVDVWFNLGDRDLAVAIERARALAHGVRLTDAQRAIGQALGVTVPVLPMSDTPVRTRVMAGGRWWPFQEFMIRGGQKAAVEDVDYRGAAAAAPTPEVLTAIEDARAIVVGPSNPVISIGPILAIPGLRDALRASSAPVVAVSPLVGGAVVKGPTEPFLRWAGQPMSSTGIASLYECLLDGLVADQDTHELPVRVTDVLMPDAAGRARLAQETLSFALEVGR